MSFFDNYKGQRVYREDKTFVIDYDGSPYQVIPGEPLYDEVLANFETNRELWTTESDTSESPELTLREKILFRMAELEDYTSLRVLRGAALGNEEDIRILKNIEEEIKELRKMLESMQEFQ